MWEGLDISIMTALVVLALFYLIKKVKMKRRNKIRLLLFLLVVGVVNFILELFVFQLDGTVGLIFTVISVLLIIESIIMLIGISERFKDSFMKFLDLLFWLP